MSQELYCSCWRKARALRELICMYWYFFYSLHGTVGEMLYTSLFGVGGLIDVLDDRLFLQSTHDVERLGNRPCVVWLPASAYHNHSEFVVDDTVRCCSREGGGECRPAAPVQKCCR